MGKEKSETPDRALAGMRRSGVRGGGAGRDQNVIVAVIQRRRGSWLLL